MSACEKCLQRLHYIKYLESKIRVMEYRLKLECLISDSSDNSEDSSSDEDTPGQRVDTHLATNSNNIKVTEIQGSTLEDNRRAKINKVKNLAKRAR